VLKQYQHDRQSASKESLIVGHKLTQALTLISSTCNQPHKCVCDAPKLCLVLGLVPAVVWPSKAVQVLNLGKGESTRWAPQSARCDWAEGDHLIEAAYQPRGCYAVMGSTLRFSTVRTKAAGLGRSSHTVCLALLAVAGARGPSHGRKEVSDSSLEMSSGGLDAGQGHGGWLHWLATARHQRLRRSSGYDYLKERPRCDLLCDRQQRSSSRSSVGKGHSIDVQWSL
jgi:hypothetical protein